MKKARWKGIFEKVLGSRFPVFTRPRHEDGLGSRFLPGRGTRTGSVPGFYPAEARGRTRFSILGCLLLLVLPLWAQQSKTFEQSFEAKSAVFIKHQRGPVTIKPSTDGRIRYRVVLTFESDDPQDGAAIFENFRVKETVPGDRLELVTDFCIKDWSSNNNSARIQLCDGRKVKNIRNLKATFTLFTPPLAELAIHSKYDEVKIDEGLVTDLELVLHSCRIYSPSIKGNLKADLKYAKGEIGFFGNADLMLFDANLTFGNGDEVKLNTKYSEIVMGNTTSLEIQSFDDKMEFGNVGKDLELSDKYSEIRMGGFRNARVDLFDSKLQCIGGDDMQAKTKYSELEITRLNSLELELSFDDKIEVEELGSLRAESKYTEFDIRNLRNRFHLNSFDDEVEIGAFTGPLEEVYFDGKYTNLKLSLPAKTKFRLEADLKYGKINYGGHDMHFDYYSEKGNTIEAQGRTKNGNADSPRVFIKAYDSKIGL